MGNKRFFNVSQIALAGAAFIWIVGFILYQIYHDMGINYWLGFTFGLSELAIALTVAVFAGRANANTQETSGIPLYYTLIYVVIAGILNIFFASTPDNKFITLFTVANLILLLIYALLIHNAGRYINAVNERTEYASAKMGSVLNISKELAGLISISTDAEIKQQLLKLKEKIDYSNNVSQNFSRQAEDLFLQKIYDIRDAVSQGAGSDIITAKIKDADMTWNIRNSSTNTIK